MHTTPKMSGQRLRLLITLVTFVAFAGLIVAVRHQIFDTFLRLGDVNAWALLLMLPLQVFDYHSQTKLYQGFFKLLSSPVEYWPMYRAALELNFVNTVFPSGGVSGFSFFGLRMRRLGVSTGKATLVQLMRCILIFIGFQILMVVGLLLLAIGGHANSLMILVAGSLVTLLFVFTFGLAFVIGSRRRIDSFFTFITRIVNRIIHVVRPNHPETINIAKARQAFTELHENYLLIKGNYRTLKQPLIYGMLINLAEILTIYVVYIAFGHWVNPGGVIIAYAIANFAGLISVLPGGVGIYEALMTAVLAGAGVSPAISIPVTVMYRVLNMLIQLPIGAYFYHQTLNGGIAVDAEQ